MPLPRWAPAQIRAFAERAASDALAVGLTCVHDDATSVEELELYKRWVPLGRRRLRALIIRV